MSQTITIDYEGVTKAIREIVEDVTNITTAATLFRDEVEVAYGQQDLAFLRSISEEMGKVESAAKQLQTTFVDIKDSLNKYIREFDAYEDDKMR